MYPHTPSNVNRFSDDFIKKLAYLMSKTNFQQFSSAHHHIKPTSYLPTDLKDCSHIWLRIDRVRRPLEALYQGPFRVAERNQKYFVILQNNVPKTVSIDRVKPAYLQTSIHDTSSPAVPPDTPIARNLIPTGPGDIKSDASRTKRELNYLVLLMLLKMLIGWLNENTYNNASHRTGNNSHFNQVTFPDVQFSADDNLDDSVIGDFQCPIYSSNSDDNELPLLREQLRDWIVRNNVTLTAASDLLKLLQVYHPELPKDVHTLMKNSKHIPVKLIAGGEFHYFGILPRIRSVLCEPNIKGIDLKENLVNLQVQLWPILGLPFINEIAYRTPFVISMYCGKSKPTSVHEYLQDFVDEASRLENEGVEINGVKWKVKISSFICDTPARAFNKCVKGHAGYHACERCIQSGDYKQGRMTYPETAALLRTDETFRAMIDEDHHVGVSPLCHLNIDLVSTFVLDYMHLICLGVTRRLLRFKIYGAENVVYNVHNLMHLPDDVRRFGALDNISAFVFENYLGKLKKMVRKPQFVIQQLVNRISEKDLTEKINICHETLRREHNHGPVLHDTGLASKVKSVDVLVDTGASENFMNSDTAWGLQLKGQGVEEHISLATNKMGATTDGKAKADIQLLGRRYPELEFGVMSDLCADVILGRKFLSRHSKVIFHYGGPEPLLKISCQHQLVLNVSAAKLPPPRIFEFLAPECKPVAVKSRKYSRDDMIFIKTEVKRLLEAGIEIPNYFNNSSSLQSFNSRERITPFEKFKDLCGLTVTGILRNNVVLGVSRCVIYSVFPQSISPENSFLTDFGSPPRLMMVLFTAKEDL
ncbi:hypothetical protein GQR58_019670 [Nymphon striatum]|nr:hypothetical protein GQR58_019670 [Nymphon striatum]